MSIEFCESTSCWKMFKMTYLVRIYNIPVFAMKMMVSKRFNLTFLTLAIFSRLSKRS